MRDEPERWVLKLVPKQDDAGVGTLELGVRKSDASVAEARITDAAGTITRILFSGERRNVPLEPAISSASRRRPGLTWSSRRPIERAPCRRSTWCASSTSRRSTTPINQTLQEVGQRFDFKGTPTEVTREEHAIQLRSADDFKVRALADILREKLARAAGAAEGARRAADRARTGAAPRSSGSTCSRASRPRRRARSSSS